jgi:ankyrin repeat protein
VRALLTHVFLQELCTYGADTDVRTGATKNKLNPLMIACQQGNLEIVRYLVESHKALVNAKDKLKRTPLAHAVINGEFD